MNLIATRQTMMLPFLMVAAILPFGNTLGKKKSKLFLLFAYQNRSSSDEQTKAEKAWALVTPTKKSILCLIF